MALKINRPVSDVERKGPVSSFQIPIVHPASIVPNGEGIICAVDGWKNEFSTLLAYLGVLGLFFGTFEMNWNGNLIVVSSYTRKLITGINRK